MTQGEDLTHINEQGRARMVDVSAKEGTQRVARAAGFVHMVPATLELVRTGGCKKGDVLAVAQVAGIMGDFSTIKWGMVRDMTSEIIEYGDPDNTGQDLKGYNQVAYRTEAVLAYAVLDPKAFAILKTA